MRRLGGLAALLVVRAAAAAKTKDESPPGPYYFHLHVPKCGGVTVADDLVIAAGLKSCDSRGTDHKRHIFPLARRGWPVTVNASNGTEVVVAGPRQGLALGLCDFLTREGKYSHNIRLFPAAPRLVVVLRDPLAHVASQFAHCQTVTRKKWGHRRGTLEEWARLVAAAHADGIKKLKDAPASELCHYDPRNMQSKLVGALAADADADGVRPNNCYGSDCASRALAVVRGAFFAGVLETYATVGLCLLALRVTGRPGPGCDCARAASTVGSTRAHHAHHNATELTPAARASIASFTGADAALWNGAKDRLERDLAGATRSAACARRGSGGSPP